MKTINILARSALVSLSLAQSNETVTCQSGLHIIVARASGEQPGFGILKTVSDDILSRVPNSDAVAVPYPATIVKPIYTESEPEGVGNMTLLIKQYGDACPGHKMALMGYSQGAQVVGDILVGVDYPSFPAFPNSTALDAKYRDNIVAVIMMGDPANVAGVSDILVGNSTMNGTFPRGNSAEWASEGLVGKVQSYCDALDYYCDSGRASNSLNVHIGYIGEYGSQAADFVVSKALGTNGTSSSTSNSTSTSTSSSSTSSSSGTAPTSTHTTSGTATQPSTTSGSSPSASTTTRPNSASSIGQGLTSYLAVGIVHCVLALAMLW